MKDSRKSHLIFIGIVAVYLLCRHFFLFTTHFGFDDMHYAGLGHDIATGKFALSQDHYGYRWGFIFPLGFFYWLFGVDDLSSGLWSMICMTSMAYGVWRLSAEWPLWSRCTGVLFLLTYYWTGFYADKLMPDVPAAAAVFGACYAHYRYYLDRERPLKYALLMIISLMVGFLIKESIIIVAPLFIGWMIYDCLSAKAMTPFWKIASLLGLFVSLMYLGVCYGLTGSLFSRITAIYANGYFSDCSYDQLPWSATWERITTQLTRVWLDTGLLIGLPFVWIAARSGGRVGRYWAGTTSCLLLCANFMTTSFQHYIPLCPDIRHYLWTVPAMGMCIALMGTIKSDKQTSTIGVLISLIVTGLSIWLKSDMWAAYLLLSFGLIGYRYHNKWQIMPMIFLVLGLIFPLYRSYRAMDKQNYAQQKQLVNKHFGAPPTVPTLIISNSAEINMDKYVTQYRSENIHWVKQQDLQKIDVLSAQQIFYIQNGMTTYLTGITWDDNPAWVRQPDSVWTRVDSINGIELFSVDRDKLVGRIGGSE